MKSVRRSDTYKVVSDGNAYGIALRGRVVLHGMERERAHKTVELLNQVQELQLDDLANRQKDVL